MSIPQDRFEFVKAKHGLHASWAVWPSVGETPKSNMGDLSIFDDPGVVSILNPSIVLVGLNFSKSGEVTNSFQNFHGSGGGAYKIRYALQGTPLWGAYMTDIIKDFPEEESKNVRGYLNANPSVVSDNVISFQQELHDVGAVQPAVVAFGGDAFSILNKTLGPAYRVLKVTHYSHYMSKEKYRKHVAERIEAWSISL